MAFSAPGAIAITENLRPAHELVTLTAGDITAGYFDLSAEALEASLQVMLQEGELPGVESVHYSTSVVSSVTRVTFLGNWAVGGASERQAGDVLSCRYLNTLPVAKLPKLIASHNQLLSDYNATQTKLDNEAGLADNYPASAAEEV